MAQTAWGAGRSGQWGGTSFRGLSLVTALQLLQARGLPVFFSNSVVRDGMRVDSEPRGTSSREVLDELLRPHGLRAEEVLDGRLVVVLAPPADSAPVEIVREEITVTPGRRELERADPIATTSMSAADARERPHLGDDPFRAVDSLPGTASSEASARLHVRGGRDDEVQVVLDGLELLDPYHLQEFDSALSIVAPAVLDRVELRAGGYSAEYGDRMSGVIDLTTRTLGERRFELGLSLLSAEASAGGSLPADRGRFFLSARGGSYRLPLELKSRRGEDPRYWDAFGKLELPLRQGHSLRLNALVAEDLFLLTTNDEFGPAASGPEGERYRGRWGNQYLWLTDGAVARPNLFVESIVSVGRIDRHRLGSAATSAVRFEVRDVRQLDVADVKHLWRFQGREGHAFDAGVELRRLRSNIDYGNDREIEDPLAPLGARPPVGATRYQGSFDVDQTGGFTTWRLQRLASLSAELGARYDHESFRDEGQLSPRLNLAWKPREDRVFRLAWGLFHQSQRPNELQVEDGETVLARVERAEHRILGFEHRRPSGATLWMEVYQRRLSRPRLRFENLFAPIVLFPELAGDRVRIAPEGGRAEGIDLLFRSAEHGPWSWRLAYSLSSIEDVLDGRRVPRAVDQPHALRAHLAYRTARGWSVHAAWLCHTGWPTTSVAGRAVVDPAGSIRIEPILGPLYGERLPAYHRLDLRVSRGWKLRLGELDAYLDVENLYDRENVRGFDGFAFELDEAGGVRVRSETLSWGGFLPSFGLRLRR